MHMAKIAKWILLAIIILLLMAVFPTLPSIADRIAERRITQRGMLPGASRRRFQPGSEREIVAFVAPQGEAGGDFTNIQEAVNFANNLGGGTIFIKSGTYKISSHITLYSNIEIIGQDNDSTILDFQGGAYRISAPGISASHLKNIHISNIQLKDSTYEYGQIDWVYLDNFSIKNCKFINTQTTSGTDIYLGQATLGEVSKNYSVDSRTFIVTNFATDLMIEKNNISDFNSTSFDSGIRIDSNTSVQIIGNIVTSTHAGHGIWLIDTVGVRVISNNVQVSGDNTDTAIYVKGADKNMISDNYFLAAGQDAVSIGDDADNNTVVSNILSSKTGAAGGAGIAIGDADENIIIGNQVIQGKYGVSIDGDSDRTVVVGNNLYVASDTALDDNGTNTDAGHNIVA